MITNSTYEIKFLFLVTISTRLLNDLQIYPNEIYEWLS